MSISKPMGVKTQNQIANALVKRENLEPGIDNALCVGIHETEDGTEFEIQSIRKVLIPDK